MTEKLQTAVCAKIVNFRFGNLSHAPNTEDRAVNQQGGDETCSLVDNGDGTFSILTPDGSQWLSIQPDGSWEGRDAATPPGPWEKWTKQGNVLTELSKDGITRSAVSLATRS